MYAAFMIYLCEQKKKKMSKLLSLYLTCISGIYLMAFTSIYIQIPGLYGNKGILPARLLIQNGTKSLWNVLTSDNPTLLQLYPLLSLDTETMIDFVSLTGMFLSMISIILTCTQCALVYLILWTLYLSIFQVGETFLWFQWDILLLEVGFLTILAAPLLPSSRSVDDPKTGIVFWLIKWLLFRLMFASGVVKLQSLCPTWWGLTALNYHFESQCIPTPLSYYFHHLPHWLLKLGVVQTYVTQIGFSFLFFSPLRSLRVLSFWALVIHQVFILLTGNYNFFNLISIVIALPLLEQQTLSGKLHLLEYGICAVVVSYIAYQTVTLFSLRIENRVIHSNIKFTKSEFHRWVRRVIPLTIWIGSISLGLQIYTSLLRCLRQAQGVLKKTWNSCLLFVYAPVVISMFSISLVPHTVVNKPSHQSLPQSVKLLHSKTQYLHLTSSYGLFRSMTGVGGRPEVIVEGSHDGYTWKEYEFLYKPGNLGRIPPFVAPHQPRLDWQMWFAALGSYHHNLWFLNLVYHLLSNQKEVLDLIEKNPFNTSRPLYVRANLYHYHFTDWPDTSGKWWWREKISEYLPPISLDNYGFMDYIRGSGLVDNVTPPSPSIQLSVILWLRRVTSNFDAFIFINSLVIISVVCRLLIARRPS